MNFRRVVGLGLLLAVVFAACGPTAPNSDNPDGGGSDRPTLMSVDITPPTPMIAAMTTLQLNATGTYSDSTTADLTSQVTWTSSETTAATIDATGLVTGVGSGRTAITASLDGMSGMSVVTVSGATLMSLAVTPSQPTVSAGTTKQMTATGTFSDNSTQDITSQVTWTSATAAVATVSPRGVVTPVTGGTSVITATLGAITGSTTVTVSTAVLRSIVINPAVTGAPIGYSQQLTATGNLSDGSTEDLTASVTWSSSNAALATITTGGLATSIAVGNPTITANLGSVVGQALFKVSNATLASIAVTPSSTSVVVGQTEQFIATATFADATTLDVTTQVAWSSSSNATATISNATRSNGLATAMAGGTATITAAHAGMSGTAALTVTTSPLMSIAVTPATTTIGIGDTQQFTATGTYGDGSTADITAQSALTWTSSAPATATISNANGSRGLASAAVAGGPVTITAQLGTITGTAKLTVTSATITSIAVTPGTMTIADGGTQQFTATATFSDGTMHDVSGNVSWASSDPTIATVSATGDAMATATGVGTVSITATHGTVVGTAMLTVAGAPCDGLEISQVYGGGGNGDAAYDQDFVELFNAGNMPVSLQGRSVQYASASGKSWSVGVLPNVTVPPGGFYLVGGVKSGAGGDDLPVAPDVSFSALSLSANSGKVALLKITTPLTVDCPGSVEDFVGYGSADCYFGDPATGLDASSSAARFPDSCTNTFDNEDDFIQNFFDDDDSVSPRSSATAPMVCGTPVCQ